MCFSKGKGIKFLSTRSTGLGVACASGTEKIVHGLRRCDEDHWLDNDFAVIKIDMKNAFNPVSSEALLKLLSETSSLGNIVLWRPTFFISPLRHFNIWNRGAARRSIGSRIFCLSAA